MIACKKRMSRVKYSQYDIWVYEAILTPICSQHVMLIDMIILLKQL